MTHERDIPFLWCSSFPGAPGCCNSCHEDQDEFGIEIIGLRYKEKHIGLVCCDVARWLDETGLTEWLGLE